MHSEHIANPKSKKLKRLAHGVKPQALLLLFVSILPVHTQNINMAIFIYNICPTSRNVSTKCATKLHINKVPSLNLRQVQVLVHVQPFTRLQPSSGYSGCCLSF